MSARDPLFTCNRLALLSGLDRRTVEKRLIGITPAKEDGRGRHYSLASALPVLCQAPGSAEGEERILGLREREQASRTEAAELAQAAREKKLCLISDALLFVSETRIAIRLCIERAAFIPAASRARLLKAIRDLAPPDEPQPVEGT